MVEATSCNHVPPTPRHAPPPQAIKWQQQLLDRRAASQLHLVRALDCFHGAPSPFLIFFFSSSSFSSFFACACLRTRPLHARRAAAGAVAALPIAQGVPPCAWRRGRPCRLTCLHRRIPAEGVLLLDLSSPQWKAIWCNEAFRTAAGAACVVWCGGVGCAAAQHDGARHMLAAFTVCSLSLFPQPSLHLTPRRSARCLPRRHAAPAEGRSARRRRQRQHGGCDGAACARGGGWRPRGSRLLAAFQARRRHEPWVLQREAGGF